jgi:hypothetical protein
MICTEDLRFSIGKINLEKLGDSKKLEKAGISPATQKFDRIVMHKFCDNKFQQEEDSDMMSALKGAEYFSRGI